jgi:hypothetical protein
MALSTGIYVWLSYVGEDAASEQVVALMEAADG